MGFHWPRHDRDSEMVVKHQASKREELSCLLSGKPSHQTNSYSQAPSCKLQRLPHPGIHHGLAPAVPSWQRSLPCNGQRHPTA